MKINDSCVLTLSEYFFNFLSLCQGVQTPLMAQWRGYRMASQHPATSRSGCLHSPASLRTSTFIARFISVCRGQATVLWYVFQQKTHWNNYELHEFVLKIYLLIHATSHFISSLSRAMDNFPEDADLWISMTQLQLPWNSDLFTFDLTVQISFFFFCVFKV